MKLSIRQAFESDHAALLKLARLAGTRIGSQYYSPEQISKAIDEITHIDATLIANGTFFLAELDDALVGCGAWCKGGALLAGAEGMVCESPKADDSAAALRSFFVHPNFARRGIAGALFARCLEEARKSGCCRLEVLASAAARRACHRFGFTNERVEIIQFADGVELQSYRMEMPI